jgi:hypothetical protein
MQKFYKGRTNNHLSWVMVDSTDFATPESALSAAMKIKLYGKLRGATGVNFVSSGTGSLTNDIQHVGASVLGIYTIALAKADLSDASAAWYDQYIVSLSATGAAYQTLIIDGGIDDSNFSDILSNAYSAAVVGSSRILLVQSRLSDLDSRLASELSDVISGITALSDATSNAYSAAVQTNSRVLLVQSRLSDLDSRLSSDVSDIISGITALSDATSNAYSAAVVGSSRILLVQSRLSDLDSRLVSDVSDIRSMLTALSDAISDAHSDLGSKIGAVTATLGASDISDIASAVWANTIGARVDSRVLVALSAASDAASAAQQGNSRVLVVQSMVSDVDSALTSRFSDLQSLVTTTGVQLNASSLSDLRSAIGAITVSLDASNISDIASAVVAALPISSQVSDIYSMLSDLYSDFQSRVPKRVATDSQLSAMTSDVLSAVLLVQSLASDAASAAQQGASRALVVQSMASDAASAAQQGNSRLLVAHSLISDVQSTLSDLYSDFQSRVPKRVATDSQLSALSSDVISAIQVDASAISDILSAAQQVNSRVLVNQSVVSDIYSLLSDLHSDVAVMSGIQSDVLSLLTAGVEVGASSLSDIRSAITANGVLRAGAEPATIIEHTDTLAAKIDWLGAVSRNKITQTATVQTVRNDADNDTIASAAVSDDGTTFTRGEFA